MSREPFHVVADVQAAFIFQEDRYKLAARRLGLSPREVAELEDRITDGKVKLGMVPSRLVAMAGMRRNGNIYALHNVHVRSGERAFIITLSSGKTVFIPEHCGNLSYSYVPRVVAVHHPKPKRVKVVAYVPPPPPSPAPAPIPSPLVAAVTPIPPAVVQPQKKRLFGLPFLAWIAGSIGHTFHGNPPPGQTEQCDYAMREAGICDGTVAR